MYRVNTFFYAVIKQPGCNSLLIKFMGKLVQYFCAACGV
ncbi:hypothetical protein FLA_6220 [Filimonas lacunae]|nr:hypothetical protein FLA_6220 [Filimonas lacunae]